MPMHLRKLLVLAAVCWVAPLSAQQRPAAAFAHDASECPYARAEAREAAAMSAASSSTSAGGSVFGLGRSSSGLNP